MKTQINIKTEQTKPKRAEQFFIIIQGNNPISRARNFYSDIIYSSVESLDDMGSVLKADRVKNYLKNLKTFESIYIEFDTIFYDEQKNSILIPAINKEIYKKLSKTDIGGYIDVKYNKEIDKFEADIYDTCDLKDKLINTVLKNFDIEKENIEYFDKI